MKDAGVLGDADDHHHAGQQAQGVEVDPLEGRLLGQHTAEDHQAGGAQRDDGAIETLGDDQHIGDDEQHPGVQARVDAKDDLWVVNWMHAWSPYADWMWRPTSQ